MEVMVFPAVLQNLAIWSRRGEDNWDVYPDGHPNVEDLARCAPWRSLRTDMSFWSLVPADTAGCFQLGNRQKVMDIAWDLRRGPVPCMVLLEHLALAGWQRASSTRDSLAIHTLETPRVMHLSGSNAQDKAYLQCLACLEDILSPSFPSLAAGQPAAYYLNILQPQLELAVLPPPGQGSGNHESGAGGNSEEEEPVLEHPTAPWAGQPRPRASRKRKLIDSSGIDDLLLVPLPSAAGAASSGSAQQALGDAPPSQPAAAGAASSSSAQLVPVEDAPPGQPAAARRRARRGRRGSLQQPSQPREILASVEGVNIVRDMHLLPGIPGHYNRARVACRLHSVPEAEVWCHRSRVFGPRTTARFGQQEPVAFLASWICAASRFTDRASHMGYAPREAEVGAAIANLTSSGQEG